MTREVLPALNYNFSDVNISVEPSLRINVYLSSSKGKNTSLELVDTDDVELFVIVTS